MAFKTIEQIQAEDEQVIEEEDLPEDYDIVISADRFVQGDYSLTSEPNGKPNNISLFGKNPQGKSIIGGIDYFAKEVIKKQSQEIREHLGLKDQHIVSILHDGTIDTGELKRKVDPIRSIVCSIRDDIVFHVHCVQDLADEAESIFGNDYLLTTSGRLKDTLAVFSLSSIFLALNGGYAQAISLLRAESGGAFVLVVDDPVFEGLFFDKITGSYIEDDILKICEKLLNNYDNNDKKKFSRALARSRFCLDLFCLDLENFLMYDSCGVSKPLTFNSRLFNNTRFDRSIRLS